MNNLTQEQLKTYREMFQQKSEAEIRNCWIAAQGNDDKFFAYLLEEIQMPANNKQQFDCDDVFGTERQMELAKKNSLNSRGVYQPNRRIKGKMVGLMNVGNNCSLSVILQMMLQYFSIYKLLFGCRQGNFDKNDKFIAQLKQLFAQLTMSNKDFCNPRDVLVSMCWENDENHYIGQQLDVVEMYLDFITKFDKSIRKLNPEQLLQTVANRQESFGCPQLNNLFSIIFQENGRIEHHAHLIATLDKKSILEYMNVYNGKINKLPQTLIIQIQRVGYNAVECKPEKLREAFIINKELGLDATLQQQPQFNQVLVSYSQKIGQMNPHKIPELQKQIEALDLIIKDYESDPNGQMLDQIKMLKSRKLTKQRELDATQKEIKDLNAVVEQQQRNQQNKYYLHCVVVHIGSAVDGHNFVYIYNFFLQQWLEYNDTNVTVVAEEKVMRDALNNAQLVSYVSQNYIQELRQHSQNLNDALTMVLDQPNRNHRINNQLCSLITQPEYDQVVQQNQIF